MKNEDNKNRAIVMLEKMINQKKQEAINTLKNIIDDIESDNVIIHDLDITKLQRNKSIKIEIFLLGHTKKEL